VNSVSLALLLLLLLGQTPSQTDANERPPRKRRSMDGHWPVTSGTFDVILK